MIEELVSVENSKEDRRKETMIFFLMLMDMELRYQKKIRRKESMIFFLMLMDMELRYQKKIRWYESHLLKWQVGFGAALAVIGLMGVHWLGG